MISIVFHCFPFRLFTQKILEHLATLQFLTCIYNIIDIRMYVSCYFPSKKNAKKNEKLHVLSRYLGGSLQLMNVPGTGVDASQPWGLGKGYPNTKQPSNLLVNPNPQATNQHQPNLFSFVDLFLSNSWGVGGGKFGVCLKGIDLSTFSGISFWDVSIHQPWKAYRWCPQGTSWKCPVKNGKFMGFQGREFLWVLISCWMLFHWETRMSSRLVTNSCRV